MATENTAKSYGSVSRFLHWLTALIVFAAIPLGLLANAIPPESDSEIARKMWLLSLHKTIGVAAFLIVGVRVLWAIRQPKPVPMHPERKRAAFLAKSVHWALYISLIIVPLSGWLHHASTTGFAPILWPLGQSLPFVPTDGRVATFFATWHQIFTKVLAVAIFLHVAGAMKHALVDRDGTLSRMTVGGAAGPDYGPSPSRAAPLAAFTLWALIVAAASVLGLRHDTTDAIAAARDTLPVSGWNVTHGRLAISVAQLGTEISGGFDDWTASIDFDPEAPGETKGRVEARISVGSLEIGNVTPQALGADFLAVDTFPTAHFSGPIYEHPRGDGYIIDGTLVLKDRQLGLRLPFFARLDAKTARVTGETTIDRRDFGIGENITDDAALGFAVTVVIELTAVQP